MLCGSWWKYEWVGVRGRGREGVNADTDGHACIAKKARHTDRGAKRARHVSDPCLSSVPLWLLLQTNNDLMKHVSSFLQNIKQVPCPPQFDPQQLGWSGQSSANHYNHKLYHIKQCYITTNLGRDHIAHINLTDMASAPHQTVWLSLRQNTKYFKIVHGPWIWHVGSK